ncbi:MAG: hypothetical protein QXU32_11795 [Nitrososphaerales archaeon]
MGERRDHRRASYINVPHSILIIDVKRIEYSNYLGDLQRFLAKYWTGNYRQDVLTTGEKVYWKSLKMIHDYT